MLHTIKGFPPQNLPYGVAKIDNLRIMADTRIAMYNALCFESFKINGLPRAGCWCCSVGELG